MVNASDLKAVTPGNQLSKFADDTYLVIPASNVDSRATEIDSIETWARTNNLTLNRNKSKEIVFTDSRRRRRIESPPPATDIARVTSQTSRRHNDKWPVDGSQRVSCSRSREPLVPLCLLRSNFGSDIIDWTNFDSGNTDRKYFSIALRSFASSPSSLQLQLL